MLIQQERKHASLSDPDKIIVHLNKFHPKNRPRYSTFKTTRYGRGKGFKVCSYCNKPWHTIEVCFKKHMIPPYLNKSSLTQTSEDKNDELN